MFFLSYILGILTGLVAALPILMANKWAEPKVSRFVNQKLSQIKEKGDIIEAKTDIESWIEQLPEDAPTV